MRPSTLTAPALPTASVPAHGAGLSASSADSAKPRSNGVGAHSAAHAKEAVLIPAMASGLEDEYSSYVVIADSGAGVSKKKQLEAMIGSILSKEDADPKLKAVAAFISGDFQVFSGDYKAGEGFYKNALQQYCYPPAIEGLSALYISKSVEKSPYETQIYGVCAYLLEPIVVDKAAKGKGDKSPLLVNGAEKWRGFLSVLRGHIQRGEYEPIRADFVKFQYFTSLLIGLLRCYKYFLKNEKNLEQTDKVARMQHLRKMLNKLLEDVVVGPSYKPSRDKMKEAYLLGERKFAKRFGPLSSAEYLKGLRAFYAASLGVPLGEEDYEKPIDDESIKDAGKNFSKRFPGLDEGSQNQVHQLVASGFMSVLEEVREASTAATKMIESAGADGETVAASMAGHSVRTNVSATGGRAAAGAGAGGSGSRRSSVASGASGSLAAAAAKHGLRAKLSPVAESGSGSSPAEDRKAERARAIHDAENSAKKRGLKLELAAVESALAEETDKETQKFYRARIISLNEQLRQVVPSAEAEIESGPSASLTFGVR